MVWLFRGRFPVAPSSYIKRVRAVHRQRIYYYYYLVLFQACNARIRIFGSSLLCSTAESSILLTSCLMTIKPHVIKYCETVYEGNCKNLFWSIRNSCDILNQLKSKGCQHLVCLHDLFSLYTTLLHYLIKEKLTEFIDHTFNRKDSLYFGL